MKKRILIGLSFILILIDQITKYLVSTKLELNTSVNIIDNFFSLYYVKNTGAAFSILENQMTFFYLISFVALVLVGYLFYKCTNKIDSVLYSIILAGIIGNFIDRIFYSGVRDFISLELFGYDFAIFNVADMYLSIAVFLLIINNLFVERRVK